MFAGALVLVAGCSFIATFEEVPEARGDDDDDDVDAGRRRSSSSSGTSSGSSSSSSSGSSSSSSTSASSSSGMPATDAAVPFPPACDTAINLAAVNCAAYTRSECDTEPGMSATPPLASGDLVDCNAQSKATCVRHCPRGCAEMPAGFPDQCDDCFGRADGFYCAKSLRNWAPATHSFAIKCVGGKKVQASPCGSPEKCADACPTPLAENPARPACCLP